MGSQEEREQVLIVGAGPVGMVLACELLRRGIACRLIEQAKAPATTSRAFGIHPRTMELFERLGIADAIEERAQKLYDMRAYANGRMLTHVFMDPEGLFTRYSCTYSLPQVYTEEIMRRRLSELGGQIEYHTRLEHIEQDEQGITASIRTRDAGLERIRADWLVGCDGAHSTVRKQLAIPYEGTPSETWMIADVTLDWELQHEVQDTLYILFSDEGVLVTFPFPEVNHWRVLDTSPDHEAGTDPDVVATQLTRKIRAAIHSSSALVHDPTWVSEFTIQQRRVPYARVGRAFVAGDAAHCHSPASAQGMNTGVQDAFNLGWKLAQVCRGQAPASLLGSYSTEREPVAASVLASTQTLTRAFSIHETAGRWMRDSLIAMVMGSPEMRESVLKRIVPEFFELGVAYRESPIVDEDWQVSFAPFERQPEGIKPGERVPDYPFEYVRGIARHTLYEVLNPTTNYVLLLFTAEGSDEEYRRLERLAHEVQQAYGELITPVFVVPAPHIQGHLRWNGTVVLDSGHPYHTLHYYFGVNRMSAYVIRPDGYVAYRNQPVDVARVHAYVQRVLLAKSTTHS
jgi:NADPH-dependent dioxygenase